MCGLRHYVYCFSDLSKWQSDRPSLEARKKHDNRRVMGDIL